MILGGDILNRCCRYNALLFIKIIVNLFITDVSVVDYNAFRKVSYSPVITGEYVITYVKEDNVVPISNVNIFLY